eukprot:113945-Chlamydomonas_euryale.AAC.8
METREEIFEMNNGCVCCTGEGLGEELGGWPQAAGHTHGACVSQAFLSPNPSKESGRGHDLGAANPCMQAPRRGWMLHAREHRPLAPACLVPQFAHACLVWPPRVNAACARLLCLPYVPTSCACLMCLPRLHASCQNPMSMPRVHVHASCARLVCMPHVLTSYACYMCRPCTYAACVPASSGSPRRPHSHLEQAAQAQEQVRRHHDRDNGSCQPSARHSDVFC